MKRLMQNNPELTRLALDIKKVLYEPTLTIIPLADYFKSNSESNENDCQNEQLHVGNGQFKIVGESMFNSYIEAILTYCLIELNKTDHQFAYDTLFKYLIEEIKNRYQFTGTMIEIDLKKYSIVDDLRLFIGNNKIEVTSTDEEFKELAKELEKEIWFFIENDL